MSQPQLVIHRTRTVACDWWTTVICGLKTPSLTRSTPGLQAKSRPHLLLPISECGIWPGLRRYGGWIATSAGEGTAIAKQSSEIGVGSCTMNVQEEIPGTAHLRETTPLLGPKSCSLKPMHDALDLGECTSSSTWSSESFGYMLLLSSGLGFTTMALLVRIATGYHGLPVKTVLFLRGVVQSLSALFVIFFFMDYKEAFSISRHLCLMLFVRCIVGTLGMHLVIFALSLLPIGIHTSLFFLRKLSCVLHSL